MTDNQKNRDTVARIIRIDIRYHRHSKIYIAVDAENSPRREALWDYDEHLVIDRITEKSHWKEI